MVPRLLNISPAVTWGNVLVEGNAATDAMIQALQCLQGEGNRLVPAIWYWVPTEICETEGLIGSL